MKDQAEGLRQIVTRLHRENGEKNRSYSRIITITSGKGGVGKTSFSINLAISLGQIGCRVIIIDGDFGLANVDLMLGVNSRYGLNEVISGKMNLKDVIVEGPQGVNFISGGSGIKELANLEAHRLEGFLQKFDQLNQMADIVLIDTGAGATDNIVKMILAAHEVILVITPEPTAITDAYALTKIISSVRRDIDFRLLINKAESQKEAVEILDKFTTVSKRFLGINVEKFGFLYDDFHVAKSIKEQVPYVLGYPRSQISKQMRNLARQLLEQDGDSLRNNEGMVSYIRRFLGAFNFKDNYK